MLLTSDMMYIFLKSVMTEWTRTERSSPHSQSVLNKLVIDDLNRVCRSLYPDTIVIVLP